jgi:branched-chain amino acid transport system permease protein
MRKLPEVRYPRWGIAAGIVVLVATLPMWMTDARLLIATATGMIAIVAVSLVLLTGWAGHVSLGQMAFAGIGGGVSVWFTQNSKHYIVLGFIDTRLFFWALVAAGLVGAAIAVLVGIPSARAGGLSLAITTLALAAPVAYYFMNPEFYDFIPRNRFKRDPELFRGITIRSQASFYYLTLAVLVLAVLVTALMRRSRTGRVLIAMRDNPRGAEAYGINTLRTTLVGFAVSGFFAAVAGALFVHHQHFIHQEIGFSNPFSPEECIRVFATVVIGGLGSIPGAILGAVYVYFIQYDLPYQWRFLFTGVGLLLILLILPGGLGAGVAEVRDGYLRWVARRRNMIVPSLLADRRVEESDATTTEAEEHALEHAETQSAHEMMDVPQ